MSRYAVAVDLAGEYGASVFPCNSDKSPRTARGFKDATTNLERVDAWFSDSESDLLIGVPTGNQFFVVDIDPEGHDWYTANFGRLNCGCINNSQRGWHLVYAVPENVEIKCSTSKLAPGVDVRGSGGYVIWWPGEGLPTTGTLTDIGPPPDWLLQALNKEPKGNREDHGAGHRQHDVGQNLHEGGRNAGLTSLAGKLRRDGLSPAGLKAALQVENLHLCSPPLPDLEVQTIAKSVGKYPPGESDQAFRIAVDTAIGLPTFDEPQPGVPFSVDQLFPQDVALLIGPGGHGKSTLILQWAIHIILGLEIFGMKVLRSGPVVLVTAEDGLRRIRHRLHYMVQQMMLPRDQVERVAAQLHVLDMTTFSARLAHLDRSGNIVGSPLTDALIDAYRDLHPAAVFLDPLVSFGPGERHVNDGEQAVITQMRRLVAALQAPVIGAHHTGKQGARDKIIDLYSGRGGSALGDGARAIFVMELVENEAVPQGLDPQDMVEKRLFRLHNAKLTDAPRWKDPLWLVRHGLKFRDVAAKRPDAAEALAAGADRLCTFLRAKEADKKRFSKRALEAEREQLGLSRDRLRDLVAWSLSSGRLVEVPLAETERKGNLKTYLQAVR